MDWRDALDEALVFVVALLLAVVGLATVVAAFLAGVWGVAHLLPWVAMHGRGPAVFLVLAVLLWIFRARGDPVEERLAAIHTTLMMRR